ncbi:hypothetical protein DL765_009026 [Monosporascus sp. GIB2]|nr:hypothetical protein DL765_009026 [Monosporascus sp. GIB2]
MWRWRNDGQLDIWVIEVPDIASSEVMSHNRASVHDLGSCPKLIHVFDDRSANKPEEQFAETLRTSSAYFTGASRRSPGGCGSGDRVVVVDGLEIIGAHSTRRLSYLARSFVSGFGAVRGTDQGRTGAAVEALTGCKGRATAFYGCVGDRGIVSPLSGRSRRGKVTRELAKGMRTLGTSNKTVRGK